MIQDNLERLKRDGVLEKDIVFAHILLIYNTDSSFPCFCHKTDIPVLYFYHCAVLQDHTDYKPA